MSLVSRFADGNVSKLHTGIAQQETLTVLFSDIRGFTSLSENLSPEELFRFLNLYLLEKEKPIRKYNGFVDKFIGDAIMAYWNTPNDVDNHADRAIESSLHQIEQLAVVNKVLFEKYLIPDRASVYVVP